MGEVIAGMARLHDLLVVQSSRGQGVGGRLVEAFCGRAAVLGAARCYLRCPATEPHRRFYERLGFVQVATLPRYYHHHDFLEYLREPLVGSWPKDGSHLPTCSSTGHSGGPPDRGKCG